MCIYMQPLPRGWAIFKDEQNEPFYYDAQSGTA